jgi:FAD/FMN-containing dehydrogenase
VARLLDVIADAGTGSPLAVLKTFGTRPSDGLLSFPRPGTTLALDFPNRGQKTIALFASMEKLVIEAGGALYPAKDANMSASAFRTSFPRWEEMAPHIDPRFSSNFWRRVNAREAA